MGGGIPQPNVSIVREGKLHYAYLHGIHKVTGVGKTPMNAAKNLAREIRKMILEEVGNNGHISSTHRT